MLNFMKEIKAGRSSQEIINGILRAVNEHKGDVLEYTDDATLIVFKKS